MGGYWSAQVEPVSEVAEWYANLKRGLPNNDQISNEVRIKLNQLVKEGRHEDCIWLMQRHLVTVNRGTLDSPLRVALEYGQPEIAEWIIRTFRFTEEEIIRIVNYLKDTAQSVDTDTLETVRKNAIQRGKKTDSEE